MASAADQPIEGTKLLLKRKGNGSEKLVFLSSDRGIELPAPGSPDDPRSAGVTIEFYSENDGGGATFVVPPAGVSERPLWRTSTTSFRFSHSAAPETWETRMLLLQEGRRIKLTAHGVPFSLDGNTGPIMIRITMGSRRYCARFGAEHIQRDETDRFLARRASTEGLLDCSGPDPDPPGLTPILPENQETCPEIVDGIVNFRGNNVRVRVSANAAEQDGPLVFVWHGLGSNPNGAIQHLLGPGNQLQQILDMGGMVAAPYGHGGLTEFTAADFETTDEVVACALDQIGIDPTRIHSVGFSAGGLITTLMSMERSNYVASVVGFAGGFTGFDQNPENRVPALLAHGGPGDIVFIQFDILTSAFYETIVAEGHFAILCDHGQGHSVPWALRSESLPFMLNHPFGTEPSPYAGGLPGAFPAYCIASE